MRYQGLSEEQRRAFHDALAASWSGPERWSGPIVAIHRDDEGGEWVDC